MDCESQAKQFHRLKLEIQAHLGHLDAKVKLNAAEILSTNSKAVNKYEFEFRYFFHHFQGSMAIDVITNAIDPNSDTPDKSKIYFEL